MKVITVIIVICRKSMKIANLLETANINNLLLFIVTITDEYVVILFCICDDDDGGSFITPYDCVFIGGRFEI